MRDEKGETERARERKLERNVVSVAMHRYSRYISISIYERATRVDSQGTREVDKICERENHSEALSA